jgi:hypothetical protein
MWIDHCESLPGQEMTTVGQPIKHLARPDRESLAKHVSVLSYELLGLLACKHKQPENDPTRAPTESPGGAACRATIPTELSLHGPKVVKPRLDLDHEQDFRGGMKRNDVNPTVPSALDDLGFSCSPPTRGLQAALDIPGAAGMNQVPLAARSDHDRRTKDQVDLEPERSTDPIDNIQRRICVEALDGGHISP